MIGREKIWHAVLCDPDSGYFLRWVALGCVLVFLFSAKVELCDEPKVTVRHTYTTTDASLYQQTNVAVQFTVICNSKAVKVSSAEGPTDVVGQRNN